jgi:hypothetical protein
MCKGSRALNLAGLGVVPLAGMYPVEWFRRDISTSSGRDLRVSGMSLFGRSMCCVDVVARTIVYKMPNNLCSATCAGSARRRSIYGIAINQEYIEPDLALKYRRNPCTAVTTTKTSSCYERSSAILNNSACTLCTRRVNLQEASSCRLSCVRLSAKYDADLVELPSIMQASEYGRKALRNWRNVHHVKLLCPYSTK